MRKRVEDEVNRVDGGRVCAGLQGVESGEDAIVSCEFLLSAAAKCNELACGAMYMRCVFVPWYAR